MPKFRITPTTAAIIGVSSHQAGCSPNFSRREPPEAEEEARHRWAKASCANFEQVVKDSARLRLCPEVMSVATISLRRFHHVEPSAGLGAVQPRDASFWGIISQLTYILVVKPSSRIGALDCVTTGFPQEQAFSPVLSLASLEISGLGGTEQPPRTGRVEPWSDPGLWQITASGNVRGVHHIESPAMTRLACMADVGDIDRLVAIVSVIRPGAANGVKKVQFTRRAHGLEPVD